MTILFSGFRPILDAMKSFSADSDEPVIIDIEVRIYIMSFFITYFNEYRILIQKRNAQHVHSRGVTGKQILYLTMTPFGTGPKS